MFTSKSIRFRALTTSCLVPFSDVHLNTEERPECGQILLELARVRTVSIMSETRKFSHVSSFDEVFSDSSKKHLVEKKMSFESTSATFEITSDKEISVTDILSSIFKQNITKVTEIKRVGKKKKYLIKFESYSADGVEHICEQFNQHTEIKKFLLVPDEFRPRLSSSFSAQSRWFPRSLFDLDICSKNVLMYGTELDADHPGFKDEIYRKRRRLFTDIALNYKQGEQIPYVEYTDEEKKTWSKVYNQLMSLYPKFACKQFLKNLPLLSLYCDYSDKGIPQLEKVSQFLQQRTGFRIRPVAGFLSPRDFLAGLAFRVFSCTQYIRHSSDPFYTPEPDVCHELLGHVPLLADSQFAQYSQEIGLASLGASDEDISKLAACYLYTNEFGLCKEKGQLKAYGAGLLSSISELEHAMTTPEKIVRFDPIRASTQEFFVTTFQPVYFASENFDEAQTEMRKFFRSIKRSFSIHYNPYTSTVQVIDSLTSFQQAVESLSQDVAHMKEALNQIMAESNATMR